MKIPWLRRVSNGCAAIPFLAFITYLCADVRLDELEAIGIGSAILVLGMTIGFVAESKSRRDRE
jgi:hypothetical protein